MSGKPATFTLSGFLKLTRTWNLIIVSVTQILTARYLLGLPFEELISVQFVLLLLSTGSVAAAGYVINDYYDIKIDMINKPERVVIGKKMKRRTAIGLHLLLNFLAVFMGAFISWKIALIHFITSILLWGYSNQLKRIPLWGNLSVSLLTALTLFVVAVYVDIYNWALWLYMSFAFFFTLWREIIKDIEDRLGDESFGCRTLPIVLGVRKTKQVIYSIMFIFALMLLIANYPYTQTSKVIYICSIILAELVIGAALFKADTRNDFRQLSRLNKFIIMLGVLSMIVSQQVG